MAIWLEMVRAPSVRFVQFGPSGPLARAKLSDAAPDPLEPPPPVWVVVVVQVTETLVMLAVPTVPEPLVTVQVWPVGLVATLTL